MKQIDESIECFLNALDTATGRNRLTLKREQRVRKKKLSKLTKQMQYLRGIEQQLKRHLPFNYFERYRQTRRNIVEMAGDTMDPINKEVHLC